MNRLKELRESKKLTFKELSNELKSRNVSISPDSLSKYEREARNPKIDKWQALADYFGVSIPYLQGKISYKALDPFERGLYDHVTVAMDRVFNEYALFPEAREKILKAIAYSIENGEFN